MPYEIEYSDNPPGVTTKFFGIVTDSDLHQSCIDRTASVERIKKLAYVLDDFTDVSGFPVTSEGIQDAAKYAVNAAELNRNIQYISIVPNDLLYGMSRMWQAYTDETQWERNIVSTLKEAEQWLIENVNQT